MRRLPAATLATAIKINRDSAGIKTACFTNGVAPANDALRKVRETKTYFDVRILASIFVIFVAALASAQETAVTLSVDGKAVLVLQAPSDAKVTFSNAYVNIKTPKMSVYIWAVPDAKVANDAVPRVADLIKSEFVKFKTTSTKDITIAGAPAKYVTGSGNEADDGDPGNADVVLFEAGDHVFAACIHGEFDDAARERAPMMAVLKTTHTP